ncbi:MAG: type II secretion system protein GspD [Proteobacteria bacterium]|nr:MAG: type II secretion system protein GspD [Pseudomonadota bacterium]
MQRGNLSIRLDRGSVLEEASYKIYTRGFLKILLGICLFIPISFAQESAKNASEDVKQIEGEDLNEEELAKDASTEINVKNADIAQIVRIFSKKTKRNFIMDERVKGKVSIYLPGKVSANESIRILDAVLNFKGFTSVPIGQNLWKIVPSKDAKQTTIPTLMEGREGSPTASMVTRLVQLKYVSAEEVKQLISPLASPDGLTNSYAGTNSLIIIDSEENIERLIKIIDTLDVPFSDREMSIIPILNADATELAEKLNEILGEGSKKGGDSGTDFGLDLVRARIREAASAAMAAQRTSTTTGSAGATTVGGSSAAASVNGASVGSRAREPKIIPDQRTNSIIVVADEDMTARIRALISKLDSKVDLSGTRFYVYRCKHAKADEIAEVLSGLTGSSSGTSRGADRGATDLISGGTTTGLGTSNRNRNTRVRGPTSSSSRLGITSRTLGQSLLGNQQQRGTTTANIGENISITADQATNSLIIQASKSDYEKVLELLKQIDIKRRQVLVEAVLLEVTLNQNNTMSAAFITSGGGDDGGVISSFNGNQIIGLLNDPASVQDFAIAAASSGSLTIGDALTIPSQSMLLNAVRSNDNVNVLSAPTLLTTDNEEAQIVVGQNVPFLASTATDSDNLNNTFNQIDRQDVGITLRLTPQISSGEAITLKIFTEVSALQSVDPELGPTTSVRTSETAVITRRSRRALPEGYSSLGPHVPLRNRSQAAH